MAENPKEESAWHLSLGIGAGIRTNPLEFSTDVPIIFLPQIEYAGKRFFIQNLDLGLIFLETDRQQFNLLLTPSYDQIFFNRWNVGNFFVDAHIENGFVTANSENENGSLLEPLIKDGKFKSADEYSLHERHMTALGGIEYNFSTAEIDWQFQWVTDVLGVHNGNEIRFSISRYWKFSRSSLRVSAGAIWQDKNTQNYYYGVTSEEAVTAYSLDSGISPLIRLDWNYRLTESWDLRLFGSYRQLNDEIENSPLIEDNKIVTLFVGGVYHF